MQFRSKISESEQMASYVGREPLYFCFYPDNNNIGDDGMEILVSIDWPYLSSINIGKNSLSNEVFSSLKKSGWRNLNCLNMCKVWFS